MEEFDLQPSDLDYKKKITREVLYECDSDKFLSVIFGIPAYSYKRPELFVEFDTSEDPDYLGRAFIRWSAVQWLYKTGSRNVCDICGETGHCLDCNACEFDLSPFKFKGPCRFQERESRYVCEDCIGELERVVENAISEKPGSFVAREI